MQKKILSTSIIGLLFAATLPSSCNHESLEDRALRMAKEYTANYCPTPITNSQRTDSMGFDKSSHTLIYYCSLFDTVDDANVINKYHKTLRTGLLNGIKSSPELKVYKDAGYSFTYIIHSGKNPAQTLFTATFTPQEYQ